MKVVTIHQPDFLPWMPFFNRIISCDLFIVLDSVQYVRRGWHNRVKIKSPNGINWLTVPVNSKNKFTQELRNTEIDNSTKWKSKHLGLLLQCYGRSKYFDIVFPILEQVYSNEHRLLIDLNMELTNAILKFLEISSSILFSSEYSAIGTKNNLLIALLKEVRATDYLSGLGARNYLEESLYNKNKINVTWQDYTPPIYLQAPENEFIPGLSIIDCLFHCGGTKTRELIESAT